MPPKSRRAARVKTRSADANSQASSHTESEKEKENSESEGDLTSLDEIKGVKHPLVVSSTIGKDEVKIPQQMALYCITKNGGSCDEQIIFDFFEKHISYIDEKNVKITRKYIRDVLTVKVDGLRLFKSIPSDRSRWMATNKPAEKEPSSSTTTQVSEGEAMHSSERDEIPRSESEEQIGQVEHSFQDKIVEIIKNSEYGITIQEIIEQAKDFATLPGTWQNLPLDRRVKASLKPKIKDITFDAKTMLWSSSEGKKNFNEKRKENMDKYYPEIFKSVDIPKMTISELYNVLKEEGVFP